MCYLQIIIYLFIYLFIYQPKNAEEERNLAENGTPKSNSAVKN